jgi:hypothetical protein
LQQDAGVPVSDSSSSLSRLHLDIPPQQQPSEQEGAGPIAIARSSSGGGSGSSKGGLRARSKSGPMLMSLATGAEGDLLSDIMNGPEGVAVPIGKSQAQTTSACASATCCFHARCTMIMLPISGSCQLTVAPSVLEERSLSAAFKNLLVNLLQVVP